MHIFLIFTYICPVRDFADLKFEANDYEKNFVDAAVSSSCFL